MHDSEQMVEEGAVDVTQACAFTGVGRSFLYGLMDSGRLSYVKLGKRRLIPRAEEVRIRGTFSTTTHRGSKMRAYRITSNAVARLVSQRGAFPLATL
jgi:excisionase family DNA binding protein